MTEEHKQNSRFVEKRDQTLNELTHTLKFDKKLFSADIQLYLAYCGALFHAGIITRQESEKIKNGLQIISKRAEFDKNYFDEFPASDLHEFIELRLIQLIGETGKKLQTGKSRNEQITTTFRLWLRKEIEVLSQFTTELQRSLIENAEKYKEAILPGFAQLKKVQPILWAHWCLAFYEMFSRDLERFDEVWRRVNILPFGSGDLAGTSFEIDREEMARELGFEGIYLNSIDAVSDRDFSVEFLNASALLMIHLSRFSEDLILYSSDEFGFVGFDGEARENEKALAAIRGKTGRIFGHQNALQTSLKSLPMGFSVDLLEEKEAIFDTTETLKNCLKVSSIILKNLYINAEKTRNSAENILNSEELTNYLIDRGVSYGTAKDSVEKIVSFATSKNRKINELNLSELQTFSDEFQEDVFDALKLEKILERKNQIGGTAPETVLEALEKAKIELER